MGDKNKQLEAAGILVLIGTILGVISYYGWKGLIPEDAVVTIWVVAAPFAAGLYLNATPANKAQILGALWGVFWSVVTKKINIPQALAELEVIIKNAVNMWDSLNKAAQLPATTEPAKPPA